MAKKTTKKVANKSAKKAYDLNGLKALFKKSAEKNFEFSKASKRSFTKSLVAKMNVG